LKDKSKIVEGKVEFAIEFAGRIFLFKDEINKNIFIEKPRY